MYNVLLMVISMIGSSIPPSNKILENMYDRLPVLPIDGPSFGHEEMAAVSPHATASNFNLSFV